MKILHIIRGVPGTGKSTLAKNLVEQYDRAVHFEADMFFTDQEGNYNWNPDKVHLAHKWCQDRAGLAMYNGYTVIVSNTFTRLKEYQPYLDLAEDHGYKVVITTLSVVFGNVHSVPEETVQKMQDRFEPTPETV